MLRFKVKKNYTVLKTDKFVDKLRTQLQLFIYPKDELKSVIENIVLLSYLLTIIEAQSKAVTKKAQSQLLLKIYMSAEMLVCLHKHIPSTIDLYIQFTLTCTCR